jgi:hypothetical protein
MKKTAKILGIIAFMAIIGFLFAACDDMMPGTIEISGSPRVGATLSASTSGRGWNSNYGFEWGYVSNATSTNWYSVGVSGSQYTIPSGLVGDYIKVRRYNEDDKLYVYSNVLGPVTN